MARGWESKSVESQMELAEERRAEMAVQQTSIKQLQKQREIEGLELSRVRVQRDIGTARNAGYRESLEAALHFLDKKLETLKNQPVE